MKVFVSWSGDESRDTAEKMRLWLKGMFQGVEVFVSSKDIEKGDRWAERLANVLAEYNFGVLVLNSENKARPWINFEAGALSKSVTKARLISFLCGLRPGDLIESPLGQFQNVEATKDGLWDLTAAVNTNLDAPLADIELKDAFDAWWDKRGAPVCSFKSPADKGAKRSAEQVTLRDVVARIDRLESQLFDYFLASSEPVLSAQMRQRLVSSLSSRRGEETQWNQLIRNRIAHKRPLTILESALVEQDLAEDLSTVLAKALAKAGNVDSPPTGSTDSPQPKGDNKK